MGRNPKISWSVLICLVLLFATAAVYYQVHSFDFVSLDDPLYVTENPNIQTGITFKALKWSFTTGYANFWHPLTWLSYMLDWQLFGSNPAGYHLTNLILHIMNTLLLFIVIKQMTRSLWQSAFVAALFALHPLHVESVAWIAERKDVLSTFFWILTMWAYLRYVKHSGFARYLLMLLTFTLGLMSKPMLVTLPFVLLLLDYWPLDRIGHFNRRIITRLVLEKIPFIIISAFLSFVAFFVQQSGESVSRLSELGFKIRICNALISYLKYIEKMFWPARLTFFYPHPGYNVSFLSAGIAVVLLLVATILILRFAKNYRYMVTGWFWYIGTLVPVIGLIQVGGHAMADRYTYITLTGLFIIIAWGVPDLMAKWRYRRIVLWICSLIVLSVLAICTYLQIQFWKDGLTICRHSLEVTENNYKVHCITAEIFLKQGDFDEAIRHYTEAFRIGHDYIGPGYTDALNGIGYAFYKTGKNNLALECYQKAIQIDPNVAEFHANLGVVLADEGRFEEAAKHYKIAMETMDDMPQIHISLGSAMQGAERFEEAATEYGKVLAADPENVEIHNNLGVVFSRLGRFDEAIQHFSRAVQLDANSTVARNNLNNALNAKQKKISEENKEN
jgi:protein O-mannosyl-transferase